MSANFAFIYSSQKKVKKRASRRGDGPLGKNNS
jgi:hypothetical protein